MLALVLTSFLLHADPSPVRLASPTLSGVNLTQDELNFYTDHLAQQLGFHGCRVTTPSEIAQLLGFERQKQLLGCSEASNSCMAELANALGVDGIVTGSIGKLGHTFQINLKIINAADGTPLAAFSGRASAEDAVLDQLTRGAEVMAAELMKKLNRQPGKPVAKIDSPTLTRSPETKLTPTETTPVATETTTASTGGGLRSYAWAPAAAGAAVAAVGIVFLVKSSSDVTGAATYDDAQKAIAAAPGKRTLGSVLVGVGVAGVLAGAGMFAFGGTDTKVAVVPGPSPAVALSGTF